MTVPLAQGRAKRASSSSRDRLKARATCGNWRSSKWNTLIESLRVGGRTTPCPSAGGRLTQNERVVPARPAEVALPLTSYEPQDLRVEPGGQNTPGLIFETE